jgi:hypothetical protein
MHRSAGWVLAVLTVIVASVGGTAGASPTSKPVAPAGGMSVASASITTASITAGCQASVRARFLSAAGRPTATTAAQTSAGLAVCEYRATGVSTGRCAAVRVSVDTAPNAFRDFQRWLVETAQTANQSSKSMASQHPVTVAGLGIEADWVAADRLLDAATMNTWISVSLLCRMANRPGLALATSLGRAALG